MDQTIFPSTEWFDALGHCMKENEARYHEFGSIHCAMVVRVERSTGSDLYEVVFDGYSVGSVRQLTCLEDAVPGHFVIEASLAAWREMIDNIRANAGPDLTHTLNYLTFPDDPMRVTGPDQLEVDSFYRYNQSLQQFFNGAATVATVYAE